MKVKILLTTFLFWVFMLFFSCDTTEPGGDNPKPPGYQEDIPWPSLADSPWPMNRQNPQGTGRSKYVGPQGGKLEKVVSTPELQSGIVIGSDSTIYFTSSSFNTNKAGLYSYSLDGTFRWRYPSLHCWTSPIVANDGTIYFMSAFEVYAVNPNGTLIWEYEIKDAGGDAIGQFSLGKDGTIYFMDAHRHLSALDQNGKLKWSIYDERFFPAFRDHFVFSPDGKILYTGYAGGVLGINTINHTIEFESDIDSGSLYAPVIDSQGNLYLIIIDKDGDGTLCSLEANGTVRWQYKLDEKINYQPVIDKKGNIFFTSTYTIYSVDYQGNLRWKLNIMTDGGLICDSEGTIYGGRDENYYAIDNTGNLKWTVTGLPITGISDSPSLFFNTLVIPSNNTQDYYIIK